MNGFLSLFRQEGFAAGWKQISGAARPFLSFAREIFFPLNCALCGEPLTNKNEAYTGICSECSGLFLLDLDEKRCDCCGKPLISESKTCIPCRNRPEKPFFDRALVLYPYLGKRRDLLAAYKFGKHRPLARFFAAKLAQAARHALGSLDEWVWTPVPARSAKVKEKGWDQIETLARVLEYEHGFPVTRVLRRLPSKSQKELGRTDRLSNLKGRIVPRVPRGAAGGARPNIPPKIILFDDVHTTGSTLNVCAEVLKNNGAEEVFGLCLFYD